LNREQKDQLRLSCLTNIDRTRSGLAAIGAVGQRSPVPEPSRASSLRCWLESLHVWPPETHSIRVAIDDDVDAICWAISQLHEEIRSRRHGVGFYRPNAKITSPCRRRSKLLPLASTVGLAKAETISTEAGGSQLLHPNIVPVFAVRLDTRGNSLYAMQFIRRSSMGSGRIGCSLSVNNNRLAAVPTMAGALPSISRSRSPMRSARRP